MAKVYHQEIFGLRETKYDWLNKHSIKNVKWKKVVPHPEFYLFIPTDNKLANHYYSFYKITEIFPVNSVGVVTARDSFVIDFDKKKLERRIEEFRNPKIDDEIIKQTYDLSENQSAKGGWKIKEQREKLRKDLDWKDSITKILYRPFDVRWILYHDEMIERSRRDFMCQILEENIALCVGRQSSVVGSDNYDIVFISQNIVDLNLFRRGGEIVFPLYIYIKSSGKKKARFTQLFMFEPEEEYATILPNISRDITTLLQLSFGRPFRDPLFLVRQEEEGPLPYKTVEGFGSKNIFYYIYAILYSNTYRTKYAEFLKIDFPRIPFTKDYKLFIKLGKLGEQLAELHLLNPEQFEKIIARFPESGSNKVDKLKYENEKAWINKEQYFSGIKEEVWEYQIGGYQVCEKWLKDRKGRTLHLDEIQTYCKIVTALSKTIELQKEIDKYFENVEKTV